MKARSLGGGLVRLSLFASAFCWEVQPAHAMPHEPPPVPEVTPMENPSTADWLRRLPGRYELEGVIYHIEKADYDAGLDHLDGELAGTAQYLNEWRQPIVGKADCIAFADAPGLQCVINVSWPEMWNIQTGRASFGAVSDLTPAMVLAGVNPADQSIRFLLVDKRGLGHPSSLVLKGERVVAKVPCVNMPGVQTCDQKFTLEAKATRNLIFVTLSSELRYLRRKLDRKTALDIPDASGDPPLNGRAVERSNEWIEELLEVSFSVKREDSAAELSLQR
jgi:hypothetical protein